MFSSMRLVECVPNISEGRRDAIIDDIVKAAAIEQVEVLGVDRGRSTNRTVITFVAPPDKAQAAAFNLIKRASELIDMRGHKGEHPRLGATDVCPFVPLEGTTMEECVALARRLGAQVWEELKIPVYLYGEAAAAPERRSLAYLRQGEYEGIPRKLKDPKMAPDFGEPVFNEKSGITVIGARPFLIAYNINLNTRNKKPAQEIAVKIRESGAKKKDASGNFVLNDQGEAIIEPGIFKCCAAVGWFIEEFGIAQVSINLTDFRVTSIEAVFDAVCRLAEERGLRVTGSEIVGLVPKQALLQAGCHYLKKQKATLGIPEQDIYHIAARSLGLNDLYPFKIKDKVIEEKIKVEGKLVNSTLSAFADSLSRDTPAPGGGSVSALAGSLAAGLVAMVSALTFAKVQDTDDASRIELEQLGIEAQKLKDALLKAVDEDTAAFDKVMAAFRTKAGSEEEKTLKERKIIEAYKEAAGVPLEVAGNCLAALKLAAKVLEIGLVSAFSDSAVSAQMAYAGLLGASYNVKINLRELRQKSALNAGDRNFLQTTATELEKRLAEGEGLISFINSHIAQTLSDKNNLKEEICMNQTS